MGARTGAEYLQGLAAAGFVDATVEFTHEVTAEQALFWADADQLQRLLDEIADHRHDARLEELRTLGKERIRASYQWDAVTDQYEQLVQRLAARRKAAR